ncbi:hypothetical protein ACKLNO_10065 [Neisseriaceae bacterium B1]
MRARYDARLQMEEPAFFQAALHRAAAQNHAPQTLGKTTKLKIKQPEKSCASCACSTSCGASC